MTRTVQCVLLKREAEGLERVPYPGALGQRIFENVSKEAWASWVRHQTMLINENRLTPVDPKARKFLEARDGEVLLWPGLGKTRGFQGSRGLKALGA